MAGTLNEQVLTAQAALDTTHAAIAALSYNVFHMIVEFGAGTTVGTVTLEGAPYPGYTGTWISLGTAAWTVAGALVRNSGAVTPFAMPYVRARISTAVAGGTVNVWIVGN